MCILAYWVMLLLAGMNHVSPLARETRHARKVAIMEFNESYQARVRVARRYLATKYYTSLTDATEVTGDPRYGKGSTEIWYGEEYAMRDLMFGSDRLIRKGLLPDPTNMTATHIRLGKVAESNPQKVYEMMQSETWSPEGQALNLTEKMGHTSMAVGDIMIIGGRTLMVDRAGFFDLEKQNRVL